MKLKYSFENLLKWYAINKNEILQRASGRNKNPISVYDQARAKFIFDDDNIRFLRDDIFTITFNNL